MLLGFPKQSFEFIIGASLVELLNCKNTVLVKTLNLRKTRKSCLEVCCDISLFDPNFVLSILLIDTFSILPSVLFTV